jgi:hypothetical protein
VLRRSYSVRGRAALCCGAKAAAGLSLSPQVQDHGARALTDH